MRSGLSRVIAAAFILAPGAARAHPGHGGVHDLEHLIGGVDYLLAIALVAAGGLALVAITRRARRARSSPLRP